MARFDLTDFEWSVMAPLLPNKVRGVTDSAPRGTFLLNDAHFVLLVFSCAAVITIGSLVTALNRVPRAEFARLQNEVKELSGRVSALQAVEQRRIVRELNSHSEGGEAKYATNGSGLNPQADGRPDTAA